MVFTFSSQEATSLFYLQDMSVLHEAVKEHFKSQNLTQKTDLSYEDEQSAQNHFAEESEKVK